MAITTKNKKINQQNKNILKQQKLITKNIKIITSSNNNIKKPQFYLKLKFLIFFIILFSISILEAFPSKRKGEEGKKFEENKNKREDLICNLGDEHECICNRSSGNLDISNIPNCYEFIEGNSLDVVKIILRNFNMTALLYTNETYEQYLRRRISQILSRYCESMPDECPGTLADIRSQRLKQETNSGELDNLNDQTSLIIDDGGPSLTREHIVILRVIYPPGRSRIQLSFVTLKMANTLSGINSALTISPKTIKYILSAQVAPLSRVLGGVKIEQIGLEKLKKNRPEADNFKLILIIAVITILMTICCTIAIAKVIFDIKKSKCRQKNSKSNGTNTPSSENPNKKSNSSRNYGTCTDRLFASTSSNNNNKEDDGQLINGGQYSLETKSLRSSSRRELNSFKRLWRKRGNSCGEKIKKISKCSEIGGKENNKISKEEENKIINNNNEIENEAISASSRSTAYQNSFMCDHSQLPRENNCFDDEDYNNHECSAGDFEIIDMSRHRRQSSLLSNNTNKQRTEQKRHSLLLSPNNIRSPISSDEDQQRINFRFSPKTKTPTTTPTRKTSNKRFSFSENIGVTINTKIPSVVLDEGTTIEPKHTNKDIFMNQPNGGDFLLLSASSDIIERPQSRLGQQHPFERPLSRRGSIDEKHEEGEEETFNDTREDTPVPLGDDQSVIITPLASIPPKNQLLDTLKNKNKKKLLGKLLLLASETDSELELGNEEGDEDNKIVEYENERKKELNEKLPNNYLNKNKRRESNAIGSSPESDEEGEEQKESSILERHHYERLLESPMIQKTTSTEQN